MGRDVTVETILFGFCVGIAATITMDVLGSAFRRVGLAAGAKGRWVGRWYLGIVRGKLVHSNIADAKELPGERWAALVGHYVIGVALAVFYVAGANWLGASPGAFLPALDYGFATSVFPWFLVFPALGFGVFGLKGPPELRLLSTSLLNHLSYGFGLWWTATVLPFG